MRIYCFGWFVWIAVETKHRSCNDKTNPLILVEGAFSTEVGSEKVLQPLRSHGCNSITQRALSPNLQGNQLLFLSDVTSRMKQWPQLPLGFPKKTVVGQSRFMVHLNFVYRHNFWTAALENLWESLLNHSTIYRSLRHPPTHVSHLRVKDVALI